MRRRFFGFALSTLLLALCFPAHAQQQTKVHKFGWLGARPCFSRRARDNSAYAS